MFSGGIGRKQYLLMYCEVARKKVKANLYRDLLQIDIGFCDIFREDRLEFKTSSKGLSKLLLRSCYQILFITISIFKRINSFLSP